MHKTRHFLVVATVMTLATSLTLYSQTGMKPFSRAADAESAQVNEQDELAALFAEAGADTGELNAIDTDYAFGLLPGGTGIAALSLASLVGPLAAASIFASLVAGRHKQTGPA